MLDEVERRVLHEDRGAGLKGHEHVVAVHYLKVLPRPVRHIHARRAGA